MSDTVQSFLDEQKPMLNLVDEILTAWDKNGCYQVPALVLAIATKLNWDTAQAGRNDPIIRAYLKDHPLWIIRKGANGGIMQRSEYQQKKASTAAKEKAKQEIKAILAAKLAPQSAISDASVSDVGDVTSA